MNYQETRNYGFNKIIKKYSGFPWYLPLPAHMEHGWTSYSKALRTDLQTNKPLMLVFNRHRYNLWRKESDIPVAIMGAPYVHFKNLYKVEKSPLAKGTIAFPGHSTFDVDCQYKINEYCQALKELPKSFQPVTVCLYYLDYITPKADIYRQAGFKVVTAGPNISDSLKFPSNLYRLLRQHKYATSNSVGTNAFIAVDFGMPFFVLGDKPKLNSQSDMNVKDQSRIGPSALSEQARELFSTGPVKVISKEQKAFAARQVGVQDCLSSAELGRLLRSQLQGQNIFLLIPPYLFSSLISKFLFDAPWTALVVRIRAWLKEGYKND